MRSGGIPKRDWFIDVFGHRWGFQSNTLFPSGQRYMDRWIVYLGWICLRLHRFHSGDDQRAPHDHPWWFITFPLTSYWERIPECYLWGRWQYGLKYVRAFRFHFRPCKYRHMVVGRIDGKIKPFWTLVIAGDRTNSWGFWKSPADFTYWRNWK